MLTQVIPGHGPDVPAIKVDMAPLDLIEAFQQVDDCRLPCSGRADDRHHVVGLCP